MALGQLLRREPALPRVGYVLALVLADEAVLGGPVAGLLVLDAARRAHESTHVQGLTLTRPPRLPFRSNRRLRITRRDRSGPNGGSVRLLQATAPRVCL